MRRNLTLARLSADDWEALEPYLERVDLEHGQVLTRQGEMVDYVYFPLTAHLANLVTFRDGRSAETFIIGVEGVSGLAPFLAKQPCAWSVEVKKAGEAYRIGAAALRARVAQSEDLRMRFNALTSDYQSQASISVACAALHDMPARLATYLVAMVERERTHEFELTQEDMAKGLGAQRTTINVAASALRKAGAIRYARGKLKVLDETILRRAGCECLELRPSRADAA